LGRGVGEGNWSEKLGRELGKRRLREEIGEKN
jgi:hypothetical protein